MTTASVTQTVLDQQQAASSSPSTVTLSSVTASTLSTTTSISAGSSQTVSSAVTAAVNAAIKTITSSSTSTKPNQVKSGTNSPSISPAKSTLTTLTDNSSSSSSLSALLLGLDYIFYIWTILLVAIVTYLSIYKYYQFYQLQKNKRVGTKTNNNNNNQAFNNYNNNFYRILNLLKNILIFVYNKIKCIVFKNNNNNNNTLTSSLFKTFSLNTNTSRNDNSFACLNNCLKWFYFNSETTKKINNTILNMLNSGTMNHRTSSAKYDDIYFKSVDTLPPTFTNIQTIVNDSDSLTLRANIELTNIDVKIELKKSQRHIDIKVLSVSGQVIIVLGQSKSGSYNLDCYLDHQTDLNINIRKDQITNIQTSPQKTANYFNQPITISPPNNMGTTSSSPPMTPTNKTSTPNDKPNLDNNLQNLNISQLRNSINEKRLLVKLIKATNLANCEEPYCVVELDYPMQKHLTDVHKDISVINEQFLFDITPNSEELTFSIYDRAKDYGNDLIGEAVLPVNDLCTNLNSKRVIQLHRYGQTKTGSIHAEFVFIEPTNPRIELRANRSSTTSRNSRSPYDPFSYTESRPKSPSDAQNLLSYRDEMIHDQKLNVHNQDNLSANSFSTPAQGSYQSSTLRSNYNQPNYKENLLSHSPGSVNPNTNIQILTDTPTRQHFIQQTAQQPQQPVLGGVSNPGSSLSTTGRVINRNYLQVQSNNQNNNLQNKSNTLNTNQMRSSLYADEPLHDSNFADTKRARSISRSLRSLFIRPAKGSKSAKRDKSYDMSNHTVSYDVQSVDANFKKSKTIGGSLKKIFAIKKNSKKYEGSVHEQRPGSPTAISITVSRPLDPNLLSSTISAAHQVGTINNEQQYHQQHQQSPYQFQTVNKGKEETFERKEPLLLKRGYISP